MSPRSCFRGRDRQRGAIGLVAAMTLGLALLFALLVVDSGRLYLEQRKLQRVVDTAALVIPCLVLARLRLVGDSRATGTAVAEPAPVTLI